MSESDHPKEVSQHRFLGTIGGKVIAAVAGVIVVAIVLTAIVVGNAGVKKSNATTEQSASVSSPEERDFINAYKDRYVDPIATYNSEVGYLKANPGKDLTIGNDYFVGYTFNATPNAPVSPLGFETLILKPGTKVTIQTSVDQFNQALPEMNRFMNLLSKNPLPDQIKVIKDEFNEYVGFNNPSSPQKIDALCAVVEKYGSNAVYVINEGTTDVSADKAKATIFDRQKPIIDNVDTSGATDSFHTHANLSITVTSYDKTGKSVVATESLDSLQFSVMRAENFDPANVGLVGIGWR